MASPAAIVFGTHNRKKAEELRYLVAPLGLEIVTLAELPEAIEVEETGTTFAANAAKKAVEQALALNRWVLGEDSGLEVDALGGRPGVYSARYSGPDATDEANNAKLIAELAGVPTEKRTARYVCHAVLADARGAVRAQARGECQGRIGLAPRGQGGFGYDPYFEILEYHRTFAELGAAVKGVLSHRARALQALLPQLRALFASAR